MTSVLSHRRLVAGSLLAAAVAGACSPGADAVSAPAPHAALDIVAPDKVVISQVYGGGGNMSATYRNDYVELYNPGPNAVPLTGTTLQYGSASGNFGSNSALVIPLTGTIQAGRYYLVSLASGGANGATLPTADATGGANLAARDGKVALVNGSDALLCGADATPCNATQLARIVDLVGYGGANRFEGTSAAPSPPSATANSQAILRKEGGAQDFDQNGTDFVVGPPTPRNAAFVPAAVGPLASVTINGGTSVAVGADLQLTAVAEDAEGDDIAAGTIVWSDGGSPNVTITTSNNGRNATVHGDVAGGPVTITATLTHDGNTRSDDHAVAVTAPGGTVPPVRISEFHYDNSGDFDTGEAIEIEGPAGTSLAGWSLVLYNGNGGVAYTTTPLSGTIPATCGARGVVLVKYPQNGLQNGPNDGIALVNASNQPVEFLSYEGPVTATDGPASGHTSTDVGVAEAGTTRPGQSLQRVPDGSSWFGPATATYGACNPATAPAPARYIELGSRAPDDGRLLIGFTGELFATLREPSGTFVPTTFTWTSETPSVATIDPQRGVMTPLASGVAIFRATATDGTSWFVGYVVEPPPFGNAALYRNPLLFGTPTDATPGDEFRITRDQYALSYNGGRGTPNWTAYLLTRANRGNLDYRCDCFTVDPLVTGAGFPAVSTVDYLGSGFDRGHMVRSNDRELARGDQAVTYYMSNIVPQYSALNSGPWGALETYLQTVADSPAQPDVYIFAGPRGSAGTIGGGKVTVPTHTWKVALVLAQGTTPATVDDPSDIIDVIAVDMPNTSPVPSGDWQTYRVTVDQIEALTGYDLLAALADNVECRAEQTPNFVTQPVANCAPEAALQVTGISGRTVTVAARFRDGESTDGPWRVTIDWGDGTAPTAVTSYVQTWNAPLTRSHAYAAGGTFTVTLTVVDKGGRSTTQQLQVTVP